MANRLVMARGQSPSLPFALVDVRIILLIGLMGGLIGADVDWDEELTLDFGRRLIGGTTVIPMSVRNTQNITWTSIVLRPSCGCTGFGDTSTLTLPAGGTITIPINFKAQENIQGLEDSGATFVFIDLSDGKGGSRRIKQNFTFRLMKPFRIMNPSTTVLFRTEDQANSNAMTTEVALEIHEQFAHSEVSFDLKQKSDLFSCQRLPATGDQKNIIKFQVGTAHKAGIFGKMVGSLQFSLKSEELPITYKNSIDLVLEDSHPNVSLSRKSLVFGIIRLREKPELSIWYTLKAAHPAIVKATPSADFIKCRIAPETGEITVSLDADAMTDQDAHKQWFVDLEIESGDIIRVPCLGRLTK